MSCSYTSRSLGVFGLVIGVSVFLSGCGASGPSSIPGPAASNDAAPSTFGEFVGQRNALDSTFLGSSRTMPDNIPTGGRVNYRGVARVNDVRLDYIDALGTADIAVNFDTNDADLRIYNLVSQTGGEISGELASIGAPGPEIMEAHDYVDFRPGIVTGDFVLENHTARVDDARMFGLFFGENAEGIKANSSGGRLYLDGETTSSFGLNITVSAEQE